MLLVIAGNAQEINNLKNIKVLAIEKFNSYYFIRGLDLKNLDTISFISLVDSFPANKNLTKIKLNRKYKFEIVDMDIINGLPAHSIPYPYFVSFGEITITRNGRNGNTSETTQYRSINTRGLCIAKEYINNE